MSHGRVEAMQRDAPVAQLGGEPAALRAEIGEGLLGAGEVALQGDLGGSRLVLMLRDGLHQAGVAAGQMLHVVEPGEQIAEAAGLKDGIEGVGVAALVGQDEVIGELLAREDELVASQVERRPVGGDPRSHGAETLHRGGVQGHGVVDAQVERGDLGGDRAGLSLLGGQLAGRCGRRHDAKENGREKRRDGDTTEHSAGHHRISLRVCGTVFVRHDAAVVR